MSVSIESAELLELFQWKTDAEVLSARDDPDFKASVESEIADVLIYLTLLAGELDIDPLAAAISKTDQNERRFPEE